MVVSESTVSGSAQEAPHPALRPHNHKLKAYQGLCKARGQVLISPHRLGPRQCRGQSCNTAVALHLWPSQVTGGHWLGEAVQPSPFLSFHMPSVPLLGLWPPSGTNHPPWTRWLGGWPSQVPLPFSVLPTYPVLSRISGDKPCTLGAHPCSMSPRLLSHGLHAPLSK